jgi:serine/threonine protein kinase
MDDDSANFTQMQTKILGDYKVGKTLGQGAFSKVKFAIHIPTGEKVAIKIIDKKMMAEANQVSEKDKAARDKKRREKAKEKGIVLPEDPIDPPSDNAFMSQLEVNRVN